MSRMDIGEVQTFLTQLRTANENGEKAIQSIQKVVTQYAEDDSLKGKAIDASKQYYQATYISLCDAMKEAMSESEDRLSQYIQDFHAQVDSSANAKIDAAGLYELELKIDKIERNKEDLAQRMNSGTEGQMQNYRSQLSAAYKKENILEKYLSFEQSHGSFFENLTVLVQSIQQTVRELQNNIQFNSQTGTYDMSKLNLSSVSRMRQALNKSRGINEDIVKELQEYTVLAVVYVDSNGKEQVMWLLERDSVGVENAELKAYLVENGKYLNPEDYTIITNEDLNKKINKAWQDGIYYLNGNKYDGLAGGVLSTSAYVEAGKGYVDKSGLADIVLGLGLSTAAIRYKQPKVNSSSAFGDMSVSDATRHKKFWDDVATSKSVEARLGYEDWRGLLKPVGKKPYVFNEYESDPTKKVLGPGKNSHPKEWEQTIENFNNNEVEVVIKNNGTMGYAPKTDFRKPQVNIDTDASYSALMHEEQHYIDDLANGFPGAKFNFQTKNRLKLEFNAYMREIKTAEKMGNKKLANQLFENYIKERNQIIFGF